MMEVPAPAPLQYATPPAMPPKRPWALAAIAATTVLAAIAVGAATNAVNATVSPTYFVNVMGWQFVSNVWLASVEQGMLEGTVVGLVVSAIFTTSIGIITRGTCTYARAARCLAVVLITDLLLWAVAGLFGVALAAVAPQFFQNTFIGVPNDPRQMLRYAWVGGSIWGGEIAGPLAMIAVVTLFGIRWRRNFSRGWESRQITG